MLVAALAVYFESFSNELLYDDKATVERNPLITSFAHIPAQFTSAMWDIVEPVERNRVGYWRPLMNVALTFAYELGGGTAKAFHVASFLLHCAATVAAFFLARRIARSTSIAACAALLFALHPVQVESVAWISSMNSMLFGLFSILAVERYLAWRDRGSTGMPWAAGMAFLLALLSKELAIAVVPAVIALDFVRARLSPPAPAQPSGMHPALAAALPFGVVFLLYYAARALVFGSPFAGFDLVTTEYGFDAFRMALLRLELLGGSIALLAWPDPLVLFRPVRPDLLATDPAMVRVWIGLFAAVGLSVLAWQKRAAVPLFALALVFAALVPHVLGVKSAGIFPLCERYLYFAVFGFALLAAWIVHRLLPGRVAVALVIVLGAVYGVRSRARAETWKDEATLFDTAIQATTDSPYVWWLYGRTELERYKPKATDPTPGDIERLNKARAAFERALELANRAQHGDRSIFAVGSDFVQANVGYAWTLLYEAEIDGYNDFETPLRVLEMIVERYPREETGHTTLGVALQRLGRFDDAEKAFQAALAINPLFVETWQSLGIVRLRRGDLNGAVEAFEKALALRPEHPDYLVWLARAEAENGRPERALDLLRRAEERAPQSSAPLVWRATIFAQQGRFPEAIELARRALELDPDDGEAYLLKGRLHARADERAAAERAFVRATELLPQSFEAHYNAAALILPQKDYGPSRAMPFLVRAYQLRPPGDAGRALQQTLRQLDVAFADILWELASADAARNDAEAALDWIGRALAKQPDHGPSHFLKAFLLRQRGDVDGAIENWTLACKELPQSVPARISLANVLLEKGRDAEALKWLEEAHTLAAKEQGSSAEAQSAMTQLQKKIQEVREKAGGG